MKSIKYLLITLSLLCLFGLPVVAEQHEPNFGEVCAAVKPCDAYGNVLPEFDSESYCGLLYYKICSAERERKCYKSRDQLNGKYSKMQRKLRKLRKSKKRRK